MTTMRPVTARPTSPQTKRFEPVTTARHRPDLAHPCDDIGLAARPEEHLARAEGFL
jgi:hypothetical protein